jgi:hypothetical protein
VTVRQRHEHDINVAGEDLIRLVEDHRRIGRGEGRYVIGDSLTGIGRAGRDHDLEISVGRAQSKNL